jgi:pSer/pThr/pTyr-binding forkhead associated (FHA) protein
MLLVGVTHDHEFHRLNNLAKPAGDGRVVRIGRNSKNDIVLVDAKIECLLSRTHAEIAFRGGRAELRDLGSTNGTYVLRPSPTPIPANQEIQMKRLEGSKDGGSEPWILKDGDIIGFGGSESVCVDSAQPDLIAKNPFLYVYRNIEDHSASTSKNHVSSARRGSKRKAAVMEGGVNLVDHVTCAVCLDLFVKPRTLACAHTFCATCIGSLKALSCPLCRQPIDSPPRPVTALEGLVATIAKRHLDVAALDERNRIELEWAIIEKPVEKRIRMALDAKSEAHRKCTRAHLDGIENFANLARAFAGDLSSAFSYADTEVGRNF